MVTTDRTSTNTSRDDCVDEAGRSTSTSKPSLKHTTTPCRGSCRSALRTWCFHQTRVPAPPPVHPGALRRRKARGAKRKSRLRTTSRFAPSGCWPQMGILTDEQACVVVSMAAQYYKDKFPPTKGDRFLGLAKEGWKHAKELDRLNTLYPECDNQTSINGEWIIL
jgi:hypothetical protein